ncbi:MAG: uncharacterized protein QOI60_1403 [Actinomycetota bacterium]|nr:uncharacterized protein [Actinomycetota bacterium]
MTVRSDDLNVPAVGRRSVVLAILLLAGLAIALRLAEPERVPWLQNFFIVFGSLLIEALPFVLIGAFASAAIEVFVPATAFASIAKLPRPLQLPCAAVAGMAFPVCECGSVPVARRLAQRGLAPGAAVTFMLAAPILNPIVIASTVIAYRGRDTFWVMVLGRMALGFVVAVAVGWVAGARNAGDLLRPNPDDQDEDEDEDEPRWQRFTGHLGTDFLFMAKFLLLGATVSAAIQTVLPQTLVTHVASLPVVNLLAMMGLAFVLSLCSESDAFVAASFTQFGPSAQLAFLVSGPMLDMKLGALYAGTYSKGFLRTVLFAVVAVTLAGTLWISVVWG